MGKLNHCVIYVFFLGTFFLGIDFRISEADAKPEMYVSNRIKIIRPEIAKPEILKSDQLPDDRVATAKIEPDKMPTKSQVDKEPVSWDETDKLASKQTEAGEKLKTGPSFDMANFLGGKKSLYTRKGRLDPFKPFIHKEKMPAKQAGKIKIARRVPMTPIEKIDLSQLRLTGILRMPDKICALVQEGSGKGYIIKEGTYIGNKGGQVTKILKNRVLVEEKFLDVYGKIAVKKRELKLKK